MTPMLNACLVVAGAAAALSFYFFVCTVWLALRDIINDSRRDS